MPETSGNMIGNLNDLKVRKEAGRTMKKAESEKKKKEQKCCEVRNRDTDGLVMEPSHYCRGYFCGSLHRRDGRVSRLMSH